MARQNIELYSFNRGVISPLALARVDIKRVALSAEEMENWMPRILGAMSLRPGWEFKGNSASNNKAKYLPFIFSTTDTALIELTANKMRVRVAEVLVTRPSVSTTVSNGNFDTDLTGWADADEGTAVSSWLSGGYLSLIGTGASAAIRTQTLTIAGGDQNVQHALRIEVTQGFLTFRVGSTSGGDEYVSETQLGVGTHSLAFTPTGASVFLRLSSRNTYATLVNSINIEAAGVMEITTSWAEADLPNVRWDQSGDILFVASMDVRQKQIERRGTNSWSIVDYAADLGPFRSYNTTATTITPSALSGSVTLTASQAIFKSTNVGGLYAINSVGQQVSASLGSADVYTDPIRVSGIDNGRIFEVDISGTWSATIRLQRATDPAGPWTNVKSYTTNQASVNYNDTFDNQILYYRLGILPGEYTSGTALAELRYPSGSIKGIARISSFTSSTIVTAIVLKNLGSTDPSSDWGEGLWSDRRGYPSCVALHEGRLWWAGKDKIAGSASDAYTSFDEEIVGDSAPIVRSIGSGPVDEINWLVPARGLVVGAQGAERVVRSTSFGEPVTTTNFNMPEATTFGSAAVGGVKVDSSVIFVDRSTSRVMEVGYDASTADYNTVELTSVVPELCRPAITYIGVQRRPDTRIHFVLSDGTVALIVFDKAEEVKCWIKITTDGVVEDVVILPGTEEDIVYYSVKRTINGSTVRFLERWAKESECEGGTSNKQADAFFAWTGASSTVLTGLSHLEGETVVVWANGKDLGSYVVASGQITISEAATAATVGLTYQARFKSSKLAYAAEGGSALAQVKRLDHAGLILRNTHYQGLQYGSDYDNLDDLPLVENGVATASGTVWESYDEDAFEFNGLYDTDSRICLVANAPRPCTVLAAIISLTTHEKL